MGNFICKIAQLLLKIGKLQEFETIPPWRTDLIEGAVSLQAKQHNLFLSQPTIADLATAIGNDHARIVSLRVWLFASSCCADKALIDSKTTIFETYYFPPSFEYPEPEEWFPTPPISTVGKK